MSRIEDIAMNVMGSRPVVAVPATRPLWIPIVIASAVGAVIVGFVIDAWLVSMPDFVIWGAAGGLGGAAVYALGELRARGDDQPGGFNAALAVTDRDLVVLDRSMWLGRVRGVAARRPLDQAKSIRYNADFLHQKVEFEWTDGSTWAWRSPKISRLEEALPGS